MFQMFLEAIVRLIHGFMHWKTFMVQSKKDARLDCEAFK